MHAGEELVRLDATDMRIALQDAEQQLARAVRQVHTVFATRDELRALVMQRRADLDRALADLRPPRDLTASGAVSGEELGHAQDAVNAARDALTAAQKSLAAGVALVGRTGVPTTPTCAPPPPRWSAPGSTCSAPPCAHPCPAMSRGAPRARRAHRARQLPSWRSCRSSTLWIDANFKEVQLVRMRIGQPVEVIADLYGGHVKYHGRVEGLGIGTGAAFALLPAQNATGNWIKVVQRVAVRIASIRASSTQHPLRIGFSMHVTVDVHDASGSQLAPAPRREPVLDHQRLRHRPRRDSGAHCRDHPRQQCRSGRAAGRSDARSARQVKGAGCSSLTRGSTRASGSTAAARS